MKKYLLILILALVPALAGAQAKLYTRSARLADFTVGTILVMTGDPSPLTSCMRTEVTSRWRISAYEFIDAARYAASKDKPEYYFMVPQTEGSTVFIAVHKGDGMQVVRIPVCTTSYEEELLSHIGAYMDILQDYILYAMESEMAAYKGLKVYHRKYDAADPDIVTVRIGDYEMAFSASTHELYRFRKS